MDFRVLDFVLSLDLNWIEIEFKPVFISFNSLNETCKTEYIKLLSDLINLVSAFINSPNNRQKLT